MGFDRYIKSCETLAYEISQEELMFKDLFGCEEFERMRKESFAKNLTMYEYLEFIKETKQRKLEVY